MATGTIPLYVEAAQPPDNSASNAAPASQSYKGTNTAPAVFGRRYAFDASTNEHLWWKVRWPSDYASAPIIKLQWATTAVTGSCVWGSKIGAITPADADTYLEHVPAAASTVTTAANTVEARRVTESSITLANLDSVAAGDMVYVLVYRDAANGSDTVAADVELLTATLEYTTT